MSVSVPLVPGTLLKLLQSPPLPPPPAGPPLRSSLLQVISIVPSLSSNDLFQTRGFYLKVSDSSHATYVALPDDQAELILSDRIQLGQCVYVDCLDVAASPVPIVRGVRIVTGRHPCVGNPVDIVAADSLAFLSASPGVKEDTKLTRKGSFKSEALVKANKALKEEDLSGKRIGRSKSMTKNEKSDGVGSWGKKENLRLGRVKSSSGTKSVPSSPTSCYSIPNSFERFSNGIKQQGKVKNEKGTPELGMGLVEKVSAKLGLREKSNFVKKHPQVQTPEISASSRNLVQDMELGPKALRKSWEGNMSINNRDNLQAKISRHDSRSTAGSSSVSRRSSITNEKMLSNLENVVLTTSKSKEEVIKNRVVMRNGSPSDEKESSNRQKDSAGRKSMDATKGNFLGNLVKVSASNRRLTEESVSWTSLASSLAKLGKEVLKRRDAAQVVVLEAMQEASVAETVVRCLSKYSELSLTSKEDDPQPAVEQFLALYSGLRNARLIAGFLSKSASNSSSQDHPDDIVPEETLKRTSDFHKQAASWVNAALASDLTCFSVYVNANPSPAIAAASAPTQIRKPNAIDQPILVLESSNRNTAPKLQSKPQQSIGTKLVSPTTSRKGVGGRLPVLQKRQPSPLEWASGNGLVEVIDLAEKLQMESQDWFLGFIERFLNINVDRQTLSDNSQIAGILTQLKRVNDWLDEIGSGKGEDESPVLQETIEGLRKKIYEYLLNNVESAATAALGSQSSPPIRVIEAKTRR